MARREAIVQVLATDGPLCSGCVQAAASISSPIRVMEVLHELEASGHVCRERRLCPKCQETRLVCELTGKDLADIPVSFKGASQGHVHR